MRLTSKGINLRGYLSAIEENFIMEAVARCGGNLTAASRLLGLKRTTLIEKIKKHKLPYVKTLEVSLDPQGEFTYRRSVDRTWEVLFCGEVMMKGLTMAEVKAYILEKIDA